MPYLVISGDLIASRAFGSPEAVRLLAEALREANERFREHRVTSFEVVRGDAFQGVMMPGAAATRLVFFLQARLLTRSQGRLKSRFGLGLGGIDQRPPDRADASVLTGPAFVAAAEALEQARREKRQLLLKSAYAHLDAAARGAFGLVEFVWNRWSPEVWRRALRYDELEDVGTLAEELGVSYQAVHKQLHRRGVLAVREALLGLGGLLEREEP